MVVRVSPLELQLDQQNPRFLLFENESQDKIREYIAKYENGCKLASDINQNRGLFLGERIVVLREGDNYIVMEGNRRTCALQFLLDRNLIPEQLRNRVPTAHPETIANISEIEVDVVPTRDYAIALMANRHIEGVSRWKPFAKNQFFARMFDADNSIIELNRKTGISTTTIKRHIREYKLLSKASQLYLATHPGYVANIFDYKISTFHRLFLTKVRVHGIDISPVDFLKIHYDENCNILSDLDEEVFNLILRETFQAAIVDQSIDTRDTLLDVASISDLIIRLCEDYLNIDVGDSSEGTTVDGIPTGGSSSQVSGLQSNGNPQSNGNRLQVSGPQSGDSSPRVSGPQSGGNGSQGRGPQGGGPALGNFFESINWENLDPQNVDHAGLIVVLEELRKLSVKSISFDGHNRKLYYYTPVAAGMLMRTAYEQALKIQIIKTNNWNNYIQWLNRRYPTLEKMESYSAQNQSVLTTRIMKQAFDLIRTHRDRNFLNYNVHDPGRIRTTAPALELMASGGLVTFIQEVINNV